MRKRIARLLVMIAIVAAAYSLSFKQDWLTAIVESAQSAFMSIQGGETIRTFGSSEESSPYKQLELELAHMFQARADHVTLSFYGDKSELSDNIGDVIKDALKRDDYSAYILESYLYTIRSWGNQSTIKLEAKYRESKEQTAEVDLKVDQALAAIIKPDMNDHEKVLAIHDWIVTNVEYDQSLSYYTAYHAVTLGKAVCQGYSLLAYKMLNEAGITALIAEGSVHSGEHAWNMVQLDGSWYHLDVTWDDPVGAVDSTIRYNYYLKTDEEMRVDHQWTRAYPVADKRYVDALRELEQGAGPEVEKLRYNKLKIKLGLHWLEPENTVADQTKLSEVVQSAIRSRTNSLQFRYIGSRPFPDALRAAFEGARGAGYKASYEPYGHDDSLLVVIQLSYK